MTTDCRIYTDTARQGFMEFCKKLPKEKLLVLIEILMLDANEANRELMELRGTNELIGKMYRATRDGWLEAQK